MQSDDLPAHLRCGPVVRGPRRALCIASGIAIFAATLSACGVDAIDAPQLQLVKPPIEREPLTTDGDSPLAAAIGPVTLGFSTYDGSGQVVHPDVVVFDQPWNGHKLWNAITPYPNSAVQFENPSLFASDDGDTWGVPEGVLNPLSKTTRGYLSDPDMLFEPKSNEMWLYYREVHNVLIRKGVTAHLADHVWLTTSSDAVHWSSPKRVTTDSGHFMVSPSIVRTSENNWAMYQIDAGRGGCSATSTKIVRRQSVDGRAWSRPVAVSFTQAGYTPWHLDVQYIPSKHEYWALVAAYRPARGCTTTSLFFATSSDGTNWTTYPTPVLAAGEIAQFGSAVYRSTFAYEGDTDNLTIWYSGCKVVRPAARSKAAVLAWSAAVTHTTATILMSRVNDNSLTITLSVAATPGTSLMSASNVP